MMRESKQASQRVITTVIGCIMLATTFAAAAETTVEPLPPKTLDLSNVPRTIVQEPAYQSQSPGYCLLVFGLEAKTRVWLVIDGESAYIDYNANGDLTEDGERVDVRRESWAKGRFDLGDVTEVDGKTIHQNLTLFMHDDQQFRLNVQTADGHDRTVGESYKYDVVKPRLATRPADAPLIHPNGPITFARYGQINFSPRKASRSVTTWLRLVVGSAGMGPGTFTQLEDCACVGCDGDRQLTAEIEFPARSADAPPIISKQALMTRG